MHHKYSLSYILLKKLYYQKLRRSLSNICFKYLCVVRLHYFLFFLHKLLLSYAEKAGVMIAIAGMSNDMQATKYGLRIFKG
jgi:hypothetical protein